MYREDSFNHEITSPPLKIGTAVLVALILAAGVAPLVYSIFS